MIARSCVHLNKKSCLIFFFSFLLKTVLPQGGQCKFYCLHMTFLCFLQVVRTLSRGAKLWNNLPIVNTNKQGTDSTCIWHKPRSAGSQSNAPLKSYMVSPKFPVTFQFGNWDFKLCELCDCLFLLPRWSCMRMQDWQTHYVMWISGITVLFQFMLWK